MFGWFFTTPKKAARNSTALNSPHFSGTGAEAAGRSIELALQHHQSGRLSEAEALYRKSLTMDAENIDALHFLGVIAYQRGDHLRASELISAALSHNASNASAHNNLGNVLEAQGRRIEALDSYLSALALQPNYVDALCNLGATFRGLGKLEKAAACYRRALSITPDLPTAHANLEKVLQDQEKQSQAIPRNETTLESADVDIHISLGKQFRASGELDKAVAHCQRALSLAPDSPSASYALGNALKDQGKRSEAIACYRKALALEPEFPDAYVNLGKALQEQDQVDEAIACYREALSLQPEIPEALFNLGNAYRDRGGLDEAVACYERAIAVAPDLSEVHVNLGNVILQQGRPNEALACFRKALALEPEMIEARYNVGIASHQVGDFPSAKAALAKYLRTNPDDQTALVTLADTHRNLNELDEARNCYERVLEICPTAAEAHNGLANVFRNQARHLDAIKHYELAIQHHGNPVVAFQNLLFCMMCMDNFSAQEIYNKHREFAERFERPLLPFQGPHRNEPDPNRRLRVGYVSPDFRANIVAHYVEPILNNHDRTEFEIVCYFTGFVHDSLTGRISSLFDQWHDVHALSDDEIARLIRVHQIDLLVDLCGHAPGNRILVFARKPAPVQISYLDYSTTTGLSSMDYRLTTEYCDPSNASERYYSEKLYRLNNTYWTYNPSVQLPISTLPLKSNGYVTFGCFNLYYRVTTEVLGVWSRLLQSVPASRLVVVGVSAGSTQAALFEILAQAGIAAERISVHNVLSYAKYQELMGTVDIGLAPFPYNGATTMLDCLWNGLPVVAKKGGETFYSRMGCSILSELGLSKLVASDLDEYIRIAAELASNVQELYRLRQCLRQKLEQSPMRDFPEFTRGLEFGYRSMWKQWCAAQRLKV